MRYDDMDLPLIPVGLVFLRMRMPRTPIVRLVVHNAKLGRTKELS